MKLINLIATRNILSEHAGEKAPALTSYKIMKLLKASDTEDAFYNEQLRQIIDKYSEKDEEGKPVVKANGVQVQKEYVEECNKAVAELQNTEVDKPAYKFTIDELGAFQLSVFEMSILDEFIEE